MHDPIHTYEIDRAAKPFMYSEDELKVLMEQTAELLRCCADGSDGDFGKTIESVALELDCTLFVTCLARLWAQHYAALRGEMFENGVDILLEAALQLEGSPNVAKSDMSPVQPARPKDVGPSSRP